MAKYGSTLAEVKVYINGKEQAKKELEELKKTAKEYSDQMTLANNQMLEAAENMAKARERANEAAATKGVDSAEYKQAVDDELRAQQAHDEAQKRHKENQTEYKKYQRLIKETEKLNVDLEEAMSRLSEQDIKHLRLLQRQLEAIRNQIDPQKDKDGTFLAYVNNALKQVTDTIKNRKGELIEFEDIMGKLTHVDDRSLEAVIKRLKDLIANTDKLDTERLKKFNDQLAEAEGVQQRRVGARAENVMYNVERGTFKGTITETQDAIKLLEEYKKSLKTTDTAGIERVQNAIKQMNAELDEFNKKQARETLTTNLQTSGTADIKQAVDWLTKYQGTLEPLSQEWREVNAQIEAGNERLKQLTDQTKLEAMVAQFGNLSNLSTTALDEQQKYWQSVLNNAEKGTAAYIQAERKLQAISQEMTARRDAQAGAVMGDLANHSVAEIQEAIKVTEQLRDAQKAGSAEYDIYAEEIKKAKEYLQSYVDLNKQIDMEGKWANLTTLSAGALAEQKKYWQEMVNGAQNGSQELQEYQNRLKAVTDEESRRSENRLFNVANNPDQYSTSEVEEAVKVFQKLRDEQKMGSQQWQWYADLVDKATEQLSRFKDEAKMKVMSDQFANLRDLSVNALAEQKKYWQGVYDSAQAGTAAYDDAFDKLKEIRELEESRTKRYAEMDINAALSGNWNRTIEDTEKAIKLIEEYKKQLHVKSDAPAIDEANQAITILNQNLGKAKEALMDVNEAINIGKQLKTGTFDGTTEEILRAKKALEEYRKTLKQKTDAADIKRVDEALRNVANAAEQAKGKLVNIDEVLEKLDTASMEELQAAAKQLQDQLTSMERDSDPTSVYAKTAQNLRDVKKELEEVKHEWEEHDNVIIRTAKRLAAYVAVYGGFNAIAGQLRSLFDANLQLSDSFADVQKTTGLTSDAIKELSRDINSIDTRSTQAQLHELAAVAGQIGLKSQEDILGFVKASNMITVSLNELGSEGTASLMKVAQLTGEIQKNGVEKSLISIGSAINELSANSAATAGPIVDLIGRMGGIASQANLTSADLAAIGATADALSQSMEITGTSMNKFISTLLSNSDQIAYSLNMDAKALNDMLESGQTMEAMIAVFERMNNMGGLSALAPIMKDLGSEGDRMARTLSAMAENVDFLRNQVDLSREAFDEAISIENEYNIKNENAIALLQRMGNTLNEMWVNSTFVTGLTWILKQLNSFVSWLAEGNTGARVLKTAMIMLGTAIALASMHLDSFAKALFKAKTYTDLFNKSWAKMGELLKKNWISIVAGAILALGYYIWQTATYVSELARATNRYNAELDRENNIMKSLFNGLKQDNITHREKSKLINEINQRYGKYLDFLVSERDSVEELAAAYELANARMRESMATRMGEKQMEILDEKYGEQMAENRNDLMSVLEKGEYTAGREKEAMATIRKITMENLDKEVKDIRVLISKEFQRMFGQTSAFAATQIKNYIETQKEYHKEFAIINEEAAQDLEQAQKATADANVKVMEEMFKQVQDLSTGVTKASADGPFKSALDIQRGIVQEGEQFIEYASKNLDSLTKEQREKVDANIKLVQQQMEVARKQLPEGDPWGKEGNLKGWKETLDNLGTASVDSLVSTYRELRDAPKLITDVIKYNRMFGTSFSSLGEVMEDTHNKAEQIKNQLASMGRTTTGDFLWGQGGGDGSSEAEKEARKQYNAVMAALEAHFLKRKQAIQDNYLAEKITGEEMNRQIADNEEAHLRARVELRKKLLGQANTFEQEQYEELAGKNIEQTGEFLRGMGDVVTDGIAKNLEQDEVKVREGMIKIRQAIEEEMLKYDIFGKFENDFAETMDKLQLLTTQLEKDTAAALQGFGDQIGVKMSMSDGSSEEDIKKKIKELMLLAEKSYTVNAEGLKEMALGQTEYYTWWGGLNEKQLNDMLVKLRDYYDNVTLLREQYQKRMEREFEGMYKQTGQQKIYEDEKQRLGNIGNSQEQLEGFGVRSDYGAKKTSIGGTFANEYKKLEDKKKFYEQAIKDENDKIDELEERLATLQEGTQEYLNTEKEIEAIKGGNEYIAMTTLITNTELEQNELLAQSQRDLTQVYMDEWTKRAERWGQWGEMFGEYLGEQVMLEKQANDARARGDLETAKKIEQQQKQNKQALIQNLLSKIVDEAALWAKEYALKMMFNSLMLAEDKKKAIEEMSLEGKKSTLSIFLSALTGQASEHKKGLSGLVTGAIIFAATMALQALAKSAIANMFPEAASGSTANRKLSTGMLTYESGYYPDEYYSVNGRDGKTYRAKYEGAGMKTGIYGGGAHFGIFSEKQPEMIVDGKTTQKLILNYPYIYDAITTIAKNGRLVNAMPTFASGDYPAGMNRIAQVEAVDVSGGSNEDMIQMRAAMEETREVNRQLLKLLQGGITAHLDGLETHRQQKKNERFLKRRGID